MPNVGEPGSQHPQTLPQRLSATHLFEPANSVGWSQNPSCGSCLGNILFGSHNVWNACGSFCSVALRVWHKMHWAHSTPGFYCYLIHIPGIYAKISEARKEHSEVWILCRSRASPEKKPDWCVCLSFSLPVGVCRGSLGMAVTWSPENHPFHQKRLELGTVRIWNHTVKQSVPHKWILFFWLWVEFICCKTARLLVQVFLILFCSMFFTRHVVIRHYFFLICQFVDFSCTRLLSKYISISKLYLLNWCQLMLYSIHF